MNWKNKIQDSLLEGTRQSKERRSDTARRKHIENYMNQRVIDAKIASRVRRGGAPKHVQQQFQGTDEREGDRRFSSATRKKNKPKMSKSTELSKVNKILGDYSGQSSS